MKTNQTDVRLAVRFNSSKLHSLLFYFEQIFPLEHIPIMVALTNVQLQMKGKTK